MSARFVLEAGSFCGCVFFFWVVGGFDRSLLFFVLAMCQLKRELCVVYSRKQSMVRAELPKTRTFAVWPHQDPQWILATWHLFLGIQKTHQKWDSSRALV